MAGRCGGREAAAAAAVWPRNVVWVVVVVLAPDGGRRRVARHIAPVIIPRQSWRLGAASLDLLTGVMQSLGASPAEKGPILPEIVGV